MCGASLCVCVCAYLEPEASEGVLRVSPHILCLSPFEPADSRSMTAHLSDLMPNVSSALRGRRAEKEISGQTSKRGKEREPMERQREKGKERVDVRVENDEAYGI